MLPDFTLQVRGEFYYWEHLGMLSKPEYKKRWEEKQTWYQKHFAGQLLTTEESADLSHQTSAIIDRIRGK